MYVYIYIYIYTRIQKHIHLVDYFARFAYCARSLIKSLVRFTCEEASHRLTGTRAIEQCDDNDQSNVHVECQGKRKNANEVFDRWQRESEKNKPAGN